MRIGFVGLGIMGSGMVTNLVKNGHQVSVWNRTAEKTSKLFPQLRSCATPLELARGNDVILCCVTGPQAVDRVLFAPDGIAAAACSRVYVECSTIGPQQAADNATRLGASGIEMLAAPVTGSKVGAQNGTLLFMTGGSDDLRQRVEPILQCMGEKVIHCGTVAQAFAVKLANNLLVSFMIEGLCEGATVVQKSGVELRTWLDVIKHSVLASRFHEMKGDALLRRDFSTNFSLELLLKDQSLMLDFATELALPVPALAAIREVFRQGQAAGLGADDMLGIVRWLESQAREKTRS